MDQFDPNIPNYMQGGVISLAITAPAAFPAPALPNHVVDPTNDFVVTVTWEIYGALVPLWLAALNDRWRIELFAESIGGGPEKRIGQASKNKADVVPCVDHAAEPNCTRYEVDITVPAGTLPEGNPGGPVDDISGLYKLAGTVFLNSSLGTPGFDLIGYHDGPLIQVEDLD
jgi:hypothetical protein